jgi:hypothetical protein
MMFNLIGPVRPQHAGPARWWRSSIMEVAAARI